MCGILFAKFKQAAGRNYLPIFKEALELMSYRGKDAIGYHQIDNLYFGHARLSILDLSSRSNQPVVNEKTVVLFKGEIYNYKQLVPNAPSDTLALASLIEAGEEIRDKLCGMYAILTYYKTTRTICVLRDFYGEKPVYYYNDENIFIISSTLKAITHLLKVAFGKKLSLKPMALYDYLLCGYIREPHTIYADIHMLSSGHELTFSADGELKITNLVQRIIKNTPLNPLNYAEASLRESDVLPALLLSGGVDSTYLLSILSQMNKPFTVMTYKATHREIDESQKAREHIEKICRTVKVDMQIIENHNDTAMLYQTYPLLLEQPTSDGMNLYNILSVSQLSQNKLKLIFLGTGGDELYGGYHSFKNWKIIHFLKRLPYIKSLLPEKYQRFFAPLGDKTEAVAAYYFLYRACPFFFSLLPKSILAQLFAAFTQEMHKYEGEFETDAYQKIKLYESFDYMRNQLLRDADNISLYCGYEARNPLLAISAYDIKPDFKAALKNTLKQQHGITFGQKKGFTYYEDSQKIADFLYQRILDYNAVYSLLPEAFFANKKTFNLSQLRKIYLLLAWLKENGIENTQIQELAFGKEREGETLCLAV